MKNQSPVEHPAIQPPPRVPLRATYLIAQVHHALRMRIETALRPYNLTAIQFTILDILAHRHGLSSADLSRRFFVTPQTMGEMIAALERRDLIARDKDPSNRRVLRVALTDAGLRLVNECSGTIDAIEQSAFGVLDPATGAAFRVALAALIEHLRQDHRHGTDTENVLPA